MPNRTFHVLSQTPEPARNLLSLLQAHLKLPKVECQRIIREGGVRIGGKIWNRAHENVAIGRRVEVDWVTAPAPAKATRQKKSRESFAIVHEDEDLIVVLKPANLLTVPTPNRESNTLLSIVESYLRESQSGAVACCVHRLDRGVSGLLVFAKSIAVAEILRSSFAERKPERRYIALVAGVVETEGDTIRTYLATNESLTRYSTHDTEAGELAITHYEVMKRWRDATMVQVQLETGRRNQIRVHLAELGHPVLGDPRYSAKLAAHHHWSSSRLALHAETLAFEHPTTGETLKFIASWPQEFRDFQRKADRSASETR